MPRSCLAYQPLDPTRLSPVERFQTKWDLHPADRWCRGRWVYRLGLFGLFAVIAFYIGPTRIIFGRWTWLTPADFVPVVRYQCVPIVRAIKVYQLAHGGRLPKFVQDALPPASGDQHRPIGTIWAGKFLYRCQWNHSVIYDFTPGREGWSVGGAFTNGPIPYPPVPTPATQP